MRINAASLSDTGRVRSRNEDYHRCDPNHRIFIVADGLGGHPAGDVASRMAVKALAERLQLPTTRTGEPPLASLIEEAFQQTHQLVQEAGNEQSSWRNMGTTLSLVLVEEGQAFVANVGDSRIYLLRDGQLSQLSEDHNMALSGVSGGSSFLTQALGLNQPIDVFQQQLPLQTGDRLLLCSDGLNNMLSDLEINLILSAEEPPETCCPQLVKRANEMGGQDNITVIVIAISP